MPRDQAESPDHKPVITWTSSGSSDRGVRRQHNEDALLDRPGQGLWAVADGMGGHSRGDFASSLIVDRLRALGGDSALEAAEQAVRSSLESINRELIAAAREHRSLIVGSTIVTLIARPDGRFACLWAGDSRLYLLRDGVLNQATRDHSEVQDLVDRGIVRQELAESHPSANIINRALGAESRLELEAVHGTLRPGDRCLLCSDGLYRELLEPEIGQILGKRREPADIVRDLIGLALQRGARDNVTAIVIAIDS